MRTIVVASNNGSDRSSWTNLELGQSEGNCGQLRFALRKKEKVTKSSTHREKETLREV